MSKQKFTLPHPEEKIKEMEERYRKLRVEIDAMSRENWLAQQTEDIRKARIMTPAMLNALDRLEAGGTVRESLIYDKCRVAINCSTINRNVFDRLKMAGFVVKDDKQSEYKVTVYIITDLGRQALEAAKQKELA